MVPVEMTTEKSWREEEEKSNGTTVSAPRLVNSAGKFDDKGCPANTGFRFFNSGLVVESREPCFHPAEWPIPLLGRICLGIVVPILMLNAIWDGPVIEASLNKVE